MLGQVTLSGDLASHFQDLRPGKSLVCRITSVLSEKTEDLEGVQHVTLDVTRIRVMAEIEDFEDAASAGEYAARRRSPEPSPLPG